MALLSKNQPQERVDKLGLGNILPDTPSCRDGHRQPDDQVKYSFALLMDSMC